MKEIERWILGDWERISFGVDQRVRGLLSEREYSYYRVGIGDVGRYIEGKGGVGDRYKVGFEVDGVGIVKEVEIEVVITRIRSRDGFRCMVMVCPICRRGRVELYMGMEGLLCRVCIGIGKADIFSTRLRSIVKELKRLSYGIARGRKSAIVERDRLLQLYREYLGRDKEKMDKQYRETEIRRREYYERTYREEPERYRERDRKYLRKHPGAKLEIGRRYREKVSKDEERRERARERDRKYDRKVNEMSEGEYKEHIEKERLYRELNRDRIRERGREWWGKQGKEHKRWLSRNAKRVLRKDMSEEERERLREKDRDYVWGMSKKRRKEYYRRKQELARERRKNGNKRDSSTGE